MKRFFTETNLIEIAAHLAIIFAIVAVAAKHLSI